MLKSNNKNKDAFQKTVQGVNILANTSYINFNNCINDDAKSKLHHLSSTFCLLPSSYR